MLTSMLSSPDFPQRSVLTLRHSWMSWRPPTASCVTAPHNSCSNWSSSWPARRRRRYIFRRWDVQPVLPIALGNILGFWWHPISNFPQMKGSLANTILSLCASLRFCVVQHVCVHRLCIFDHCHYWQVNNHHQTFSDMYSNQVKM